MSSWWQFTASSQFYLYGKRTCTSTGYESAMKTWLKKNTKDGKDPLEAEDLSGLGMKDKVVLVTGANSGVGKELCKFLARSGARVYMVSRNLARGEAAQKEILEQARGNKEVHLLVGDCSLEADVRRLWTEYASCFAGPSTLDLLVCNAGALLNEKTLTSEGVETTFACHLLFGVYLLVNLALPSLERTTGSRVVVVSSGGMYNTKFPGIEIASGREGDYEGNMAYAYAKRGQVLLCERWAKELPQVKFVSCHPGWTDTPGVDDAYGSKKSYLEPLRSTWQGTSGIAWLCVTNATNLQGGEFYLDRTPQRKHIAGAFFSEGSFTKNKPEEVDTMMQSLNDWARGKRPSETSLGMVVAAPVPSDSAVASTTDHLTEMSKRVETLKFMGRWFVLANIPSTFDNGKINCIEDYNYDADNDRIDVVFQSQSSVDAKPSVVLQRATVSNKETNTRWAMSVKMIEFYVPLSLAFLILDCSDDYSTCIVGVPNRKYVWIMSREPLLQENQLQGLIDRTVALGFDATKIQRIEHNFGENDANLPPFSFKDADTLQTVESSAATTKTYASASNLKTPPPTFLELGQKHYIRLVRSNTRSSQLRPRGANGENSTCLRITEEESDLPLSESDNEFPVIEVRSSSRESIIRPDDDRSGTVFHSLAPEFLPRPTFCSSCRRFIWGLTLAQQQAQVCVTCGCAVHGRCFDRFARQPCNSEGTATGGGDQQFEDWLVEATGCGNATVECIEGGLVTRRLIFIVLGGDDNDDKNYDDQDSDDVENREFDDDDY